jgi:hypothetical protein
MNTYRLQASYREESISTVDLQYWERDRIKETARGIVARRRAPGRILSFSSLYFRELRDAVDRAAEELSTRPDEDLDYYWTARRGIPTYYAPLFLGVPRKSYLRSASLESIGEGLALYLLEDRIRHPELFGLELFCRPLGSSPDLMMYYRRDPSRLALVEAKATEKKKVAEHLTQAVIQLIDVFKGWQNHRDLATTDGFAVATSVSTPGTFEVTILKMVFRP